MTKKSEKPMMSKEELNRLISMAEPYSTIGNDTESTLQTDDGEGKMIAEPTVERARKVANVENVASMSTGPTGPTEHIVPTMPSRTTAPAMPEPSNAPAQPDPLRRLSAKQRKASFEEYRETFLLAPKITDRQPVFLSRTTRDSIDSIVRKLGERKMSVSGLLENIARHHLENYAEDIEVWKRL